MPVKMPRAYVVGGGFPYIKLFHELGFLGAKHAAEADVVVFTGGADIDPALYGERPLKVTSFNTERDRTDLEAYAAARSNNSQEPVLIGICRGAQFLNAMNGGKMWQDVTDHVCSPHPVNDICFNMKDLDVTSTHHQMMIPADDALVLATANIAREKFAFGKDEFRSNLEDPFVYNDTEVIWYDQTRSLCFQPHPEHNHRPTTEYFARLVDDFVLPVI